MNATQYEPFDHPPEVVKLLNNAPPMTRRVLMLYLDALRDQLNSTRRRAMALADGVVNAMEVMRESMVVASMDAEQFAAAQKAKDELMTTMRKPGGSS